MSDSSSAVHRVLLVRTSALGDIVHCLPFLERLRELLPEAEIAWVVEKVWGRILEDHPKIERLIPVRAKAWRKAPFSSQTRREIRRAIGAMRAFKPDVTFDLMGNFKGAVLARLSAAPRIIGASAASRRERASARWMTETVDVDGIHAVDKALGLLRALGDAGGGSPADLGGDSLLRTGSAEAERFLRERPRRDRRLVLIQAGAGWANKIYPLDRWAQVAAGLDAEGFDVWLPTAPGEEHLAEEVCRLSSGAARTVDATDFQLLAALMRHASLFLGGDTGPVHLAHALGTPVLSIIGPTDPARNGPYGAPDRVVFQPLPCSYCYKRFDGPRACLLSIPARRVLDQALSVLDSSSEGKSRA